MSHLTVAVCLCEEGVGVFEGAIGKAECLSG